MYSKLIHTVDHVEGYLREGFDSLDAFLCHTWAVTVTGDALLYCTLLYSVLMRYTAMQCTVLHSPALTI